MKTSKFLNHRSLKAELKTFMGCDVGEQRAGVLTRSSQYEKYRRLCADGLLQIICFDGKYNWFGLTEKGKNLLRPFEQR